jgi:hypothetical protein
LFEPTPNPALTFSFLWDIGYQSNRFVAPVGQDEQQDGLEFKSAEMDVWREYMDNATCPLDIVANTSQALALAVAWVLYATVRLVTGDSWGLDHASQPQRQSSPRAQVSHVSRRYVVVHMRVLPY